MLLKNAFEKQNESNKHMLFYAAVCTCHMSYQTSNVILALPNISDWGIVLLCLLIWLKACWDSGRSRRSLIFTLSLMFSVCMHIVSSLEKQGNTTFTFVLVKILTDCYSPYLCGWPFAPHLSCGSCLIEAPLLQPSEPLTGTRRELTEKRRWLQLVSVEKLAKIAFLHMHLVQFCASRPIKSP